MLLKNHFAKKAKTFLAHRCPSVLMGLTSIAAHTVMYKRERDYLAGKLPTKSDAPSVFFFSYNRCGSMYVSHLIERIVASAKLQAVDLGQFAFHGDQKLGEKMKDPEAMSKLLKMQGYYFGAYRHPLWFPEMKDSRIVLVLRDPRDVLVSRYFSVAYAHTPKDAKFVADRKRAQEQGIEQFVRERLHEVREPYQRFAEDFLPRENVLFLQYEDMVNQFPVWLRQLADFLVDEPDEELLKTLISESDFRPNESEDKYAHKRSGKPGGYRDKLNEETIRWIEEEFGEVLTALNYQSYE